MISLTWRVARLSLGVTILAFLFPTTVVAQTIRGQVTDAVTGESLPGAWLEVLDTSGERIRATLSRSDGLYELDATGAAALVASFIGYADDRLALGVAKTTDTLFIDIGLTVRPVSLEGIDVVAEERCGDAPFEAAAAQRIWDEARQALEVAEWTVKEQLFRYEIERYVRRLDQNAFQVLSEERAERPSWGIRPFRSPDGADLREEGYVRTVDGETTYYAPDVQVLLSDGFLQTHCFSAVVGSGAHAGKVGLAFRPTPDRRVPDIMGEFWLSAETGRLRSVDFRYVGLERDIDTSMLGGHVSFQAIEDGPWVVDRWWIRTPVIGLQRVSGSTRTREVVVAIEEVGGEVLRLGRVGAVESVAGPRGRIEGTVVNEGTEDPVENATVRLSGTPYLARTSSDGSFAIRGIRVGTYRLAVHHPSLARLGQDTVRALVTASSEEVEDLRVRIPSISSVLTRRCAERGESLEPGSVAVAGTVVDARTGVPIPAARVEAAWGRVDPVDGLEDARVRRQSTADGSGRYVFCGISAPERVVLTARFLGVTDTAVVDVSTGRLADATLALPLSGVVVVAGAVRDGSTKEPIDGAEVTLGGTTVLTDDSGGFVIPGVSAGLHEVRIDHIAFGERRDSVMVSGSASVTLEITLMPEAFELEGMTVEVDSERAARYRRYMARGTRVDVIEREAIEKAALGATSLGDILVSPELPFLRAFEVNFPILGDSNFRTTRPGLCVELSRQHGGGCRMPEVFVNDMLLNKPEFSLMDIDPGAVERIEIIPPLEAGAQFGTSGGDGVILIYLRGRAP